MLILLLDRILITSRQFGRWVRVIQFCVLVLRQLLLSRIYGHHACFHVPCQCALGRKFIIKGFISRIWGLELYFFQLVGFQRIESRFVLVNLMTGVNFHIVVILYLTHGSGRKGFANVVADAIDPEATISMTFVARMSTHDIWSRHMLHLFVVCHEASVQD